MNPRKVSTGEKLVWTCKQCGREYDALDVNPPRRTPLLWDDRCFACHERERIVSKCKAEYLHLIGMTVEDVIVEDPPQRIVGMVKALVLQAPDGSHHRVDIGWYDNVCGLESRKLEEA